MIGENYQLKNYCYFSILSHLDQEFDSEKWEIAEITRFADHRFGRWLQNFQRQMRNWFIQSLGDFGWAEIEEASCPPSLIIKQARCDFSLNFQEPIAFIQFQTNQSAQGQKDGLAGSMQQSSFQGPSSS